VRFPHKLFNPAGRETVEIEKKLRSPSSHPLFDFGPQTSDSELPRTSDFGHRTSDFPRTSPAKIRNFLPFVKVPIHDCGKIVDNYGFLYKIFCCLGAHFPPPLIFKERAGVRLLRLLNYFSANSKISATPAVGETPGAGLRARQFRAIRCQLIWQGERRRLCRRLSDLSVS
jgi:hypothetical protein